MIYDLQSKKVLLEETLIGHHIKYVAPPILFARFKSSLNLPEPGLKGSSSSRVLLKYQ